MANFQAQDGNLIVQPVAAMPDGDGSFLLLRSSEHRKATFRYAGTFTPVATPTDAIIIQGSATRTLRIKHIMLGGLATTAGLMNATLIRRSTADATAGVLTAVTPGKMDTADAAPTGVVSTVGTANFTTLGTTAGNLGQVRLWLPLVTGTPAPLTWAFATRQDKALILRGVLDFVAINFNGSAVPAGGVIDYEIEIEEDQS
jgi:hypothetical protein